MIKIATREAYGKALVALGAENPGVVVLDADLAKSTKTIEFKKHFPRRFFDLGVAEANMIGTAAGLATAGKVPFCSTFAVFATGRVFDQIRQSVAYPRLNVTIAATHAGITVGEDGASHQSVEDIVLMRVLPHMTVFVPADAVETAGAVRAAAEIDGPVYIRLGRVGVPVLHGDDFRFEPGRGVEMRRGLDATIIACGLMVGQALAAAEQLAAEEIDVGVLNIHTLKPLDVQAIVDAAQRTGAIVTAEEHSIIGGLGSAVAEVLSEHYPVPMLRVGLRDVFGESGKPDELLQEYGLTSADIVNAVYNLL
jgi:transketolase